ncbi:4'-phosphopantetheinyl transferase family protein [Streptomyces desertarenae]|uniref:4'-phosphopantetheinyl transferase family protein n=1 Tax=Streptomyces desertarenae TaxID=2666184 RepID=A0ABW4PRG7_9ACTN
MTTAADLCSLTLRLDRLVEPSALPAPGEALVRFVDAKTQAPSAEQLAPDVLDAMELRRADRFARPRDRASYLVAHVALRLLLGELLDTSPRDLVMSRDACPECGGPSGRPVLLGGGAHFSLSHSRDVVFVACASTPVGVDVEAAPVPEVMARSKDFFHPDESAELAALPECRRAAAFARLWARKEACLKGTGAGLAHDGHRSYLGTGPAAEAVPPPWSLTDLPAPEGFAAALALRAPSVRWC